MNESLVCLCAKIKKLCDLFDITLAELEQFSKIGKNTITNWPKAKTMPSADKILRIANYFDVSVDYLLGNTNDPKSHKNEVSYNSVTQRLIIFSEKMEYSDPFYESSRKIMQFLQVFIENESSNDRTDSV